MKIIKFIKREAINWLLISLPFIYTLLVYNRMPRFAPFQIDNEQIIYYNLLFVMGLAIISYIVLLVKPSIVPKTAFHDNLRSLNRIRTLMLVFFSFTCLIFISKEIGIPFNWTKTGFLLAMGFMAVFGNLYPTYKCFILRKRTVNRLDTHLAKIYKITIRGVVIYEG